jgi:homoserine trans-succinylase
MNLILLMEGKMATERQVSNITTLKILVKSEICRACEVNRSHKKFILIPVHTLCICNVLAQLHERDSSSSK